MEVVMNKHQEFASNNYSKRYGVIRFDLLVSKYILSSYEVAIMYNAKYLQESFSLISKLKQFFDEKENKILSYLNKRVGETSFFYGDYEENFEGKNIVYGKDKVPFLYIGFSLDLVSGDDYKRYNKNAFGVRIRKDPEILNLYKWNHEKIHIPNSVGIFEDDDFIYIPVDISHLLGITFDTNLFTEVQKIFDKYLFKFLK